MSCKHKFSYMIGHQIIITEICMRCNATEEQVEKEFEKDQAEIDKFRRKIMSGKALYE